MSEPSFEVDLEPVRFAATADVIHRPGSVRLDDYPLLVFALDQHGPGIRTEDSGASVEEICRTAATAGEREPDLDGLAAQFGTTPAHILQALEFGYRVGFATHE